MSLKWPRVRLEQHATDSNKMKGDDVNDALRITEYDDVSATGIRGLDDILFRGLW